MGLGGGMVLAIPKFTIRRTSMLTTQIRQIVQVTQDGQMGHKEQKVQNAQMALDGRIMRGELGGKPLMILGMKVQEL